ncbi:MAG: fructose-bisphosphate aldolase class I [Deltaproteobacteria bacterium CG_4_10_14_0_2_um_filter_43_8]|nr:MAG: fructose-bisphosphate aldolase class I [Deltaproteobacteria bacterium CG11_big_fil_rev_8_21_14_0_20_42_23]PJA20487.1 MAG: fructose-bisphosphate aldolase class I [Deltaproteobacteria bacterium CG_4_10_14_0_2_um_filter_43_8]PJC63361.1 MAG: fructose-bisphosphate aldolase class I [Deltaproteobacteria bacterium CG_4_9_14_0_2_um_filter_42_21]
MDTSQLERVAKAMGAKGKGILAADESNGTIKKRFDTIQVESSEKNRQAYRQLLFTTEGAEQFMSGVILYDETIRQSTDDGVPFPKYLEQNGVIPGIKVDMGAKDLPNFPGEKITEGLDGLSTRLKEYYELGARFAKWRAVIEINEILPSDYCIKANAHALARYAALCQENNIVPIVEPEVLMDGAHTLSRCREVTAKVWKIVFDELRAAKVYLPGMVLKPNMIISGKKCAQQASVDEVAKETVTLLKEYVPAEVPSIVFLSGGQSSIAATEHLNAMNKLGDLPWNLSFSYGRALQEDTLKAWAGKKENISSAKKVFLHRIECNGLATLGKYTAG